MISQQAPSRAARIADLTLVGFGHILVIDSFNGQEYSPRTLFYYRLQVLTLVSLTTEVEPIMDTVRIILKGIFTYVLYPAVVLALFSFIVIFIARIVSEGKGLSSRVRRLTGAFLPVVVLIFVLLVTEQGDEPIKHFIVSIPSVIHLLIGAAVGLGFIEIGRLLMRGDDDTGPSVYKLVPIISGCFRSVFYNAGHSI